MLLADPPHQIDRRQDHDPLWRVVQGRARHPPGVDKEPPRQALPPQVPGEARDHRQWHVALVPLALDAAPNAIRVDPPIEASVPGVAVIPHDRPSPPLKGVQNQFLEHPGIDLAQIGNAPCDRLPIIRAFNR